MKTSNNLHGTESLIVQASKPAGETSMLFQDKNFPLHINSPLPTNNYRQETCGHGCGWEPCLKLHSRALRRRSCHILRAEPMMVALLQKDAMMRATLCMVLATILVKCTTVVSTSTVKYQVIKYYVHDDLLQGANNSAFVIAAPGGDLNNIQQGTLVAINDPITEGPEVNSRKLGNAQGVYLTAELEPNSFHIHQQFTAVFKDKYNGTISYQGDDAVLLQVREIAVVGGTGDFRNAFGYCLITTVNQTDTWSFLLEFETHLYIPELKIIQNS